MIQAMYFLSLSSYLSFSCFCPFSLSSLCLSFITHSFLPFLSLHPPILLSNFQWRIFFFFCTKSQKQPTFFFPTTKFYLRSFSHFPALPCPTTSLAPLTLSILLPSFLPDLSLPRHHVLGLTFSCLLPFIRSPLQRRDYSSGGVENEGRGDVGDGARGGKEKGRRRI